MMKRHRIELPPQRRTLYIDRHPSVTTVSKSSFPQYEPDTVSYKQGYWVLPIHTNLDGTRGTFLYLYDDGKIERITIREDEGDEVVLVKPADKDIK